MKLKKLELFGFKSFADRTTVAFDEGVTCVVGPNGCGKSNISDAIRWVLGERSAKLLRGSKMEDVIFNGTDFRKPLALAEVSLTIDNTTRGLPIDYNEVTLTRRLYRSGESEYLLNKTVCRLKDIQDLILDTGIGSSSYSMIEQGRIDYILNADADERRFLIEEAAGISKYKVKKEEAIRKLERTEENRLRLNDIVVEVQRNIQYAERQAKRAARFQDLFEKLKLLEIRKAFYDESLIRDERGDLSSNQDGFKGDLESKDAALAEARGRQEEILQAARGIAARLEEQEARRYQMISRIDQIQQTLVFHEEQRVQMATREAAIAEEQLLLGAQIRHNEVQIEAKRAEIDAFGTDRSKAEETYRGSEQALRDAEDALRQSKQRVEALKLESLEVASEAARLRNEVHRISVFLDTRQEQKRHRQADANRLRQEASSWDAKKQSCSVELRELETKIASLKQEQAERKERLAGLESRSSQAHDALRVYDQELRELRTQLKMLSEIEAAFLKHENELRPEDGALPQELVRSIREVLRVREGFEWALDAALDSYANSFVVADPEAAADLLGRIRARKPASMGLLIRGGVERDLEWMKTEPRVEHPDITHALIDLVEIEAGYEEALLPFLSGTYLVSSLEGEAWTRLLPLAQEYRLLSEDGVVAGPYGTVLFRNNFFSELEPSFKRIAQIEKMRATATMLEAQHAEKALEIGGLQRDLTEERAALERCESGILDVSIQKESFDSLRIGMEDRLGSYQRELELISLETNQMQVAEEDDSSRKISSEAALRDAETRVEQVSSRHQELQAQVETADARRSEALGTFAQDKVRWEGIEERYRMLEGSLKVLCESDERDRKRVRSLEQETGEIREKGLRLTDSDRELREELGSTQNHRTEIEAGLGILRSEKERSESELAVVGTRIEGLHAEQQGLQSALHGYEMKIMDLNFREKTLHERLFQSYKIRLSECLPPAEPLRPEEVPAVDETLGELRGKVENLGTVNLLAIEEFEELKTRFEFLQAQQKDLEDARNQLLETIRKINKTTKGLFEQTFQTVQVYFQSYYETLFQGGYARLILVDEANPLESGIDIVVRPPAKKPTHITLLSGGEKALTAIALLFALFKVKPSPFCVLDEVDAPLDEANVDRFVTVLREFLTSSQFILVTHNRKTIAMGDSLFGVTMQEPGISKIVSVKVNQTAAASAAADGVVREEVLLDDLIPVKSGPSVR
ncbi:MAG: chromosome segregation protein SMC [Candidatus Omnitrophota bacterium]|jgi:chromosome segregation protein